MPSLEWNVPTYSKLGLTHLPRTKKQHLSRESQLNHSLEMAPDLQACGHWFWRHSVVWISTFPGYLSIFLMSCGSKVNTNIVFSILSYIQYCLSNHPGHPVLDAKPLVSESVSPSLFWTSCYTGTTWLLNVYNSNITLHMEKYVMNESSLTNLKSALIQHILIHQKCQKKTKKNKAARKSNAAKNCKRYNPM